jgi:magnesium chelatase subunit D
LDTLPEPASDTAPMAIHSPDPFSLAVLLLAVDPSGLGGVVLRSPGGPAPAAWLKLLRSHLPRSTPWRRLPLGITPDRLVGGVDLSATLAQGRRILRSGLLAETHGGFLVLPSAERLAAETVPPLLEALDGGRIRVERDGISAEEAAQVALVLLDEGQEEEPGIPEAVLDRLAFHLPLPPRWAGNDPDGVPAASPEAERILRARAALPDVKVPDPILRELTLLAQLGGIRSLRPVVLALRATRALAALQGREAATPEDGRLAAILVLAPRGAPIPWEETAEGEDSSPPPDHPLPEPPTPGPSDPDDSDRPPPTSGEGLDDPSRRQAEEPGSPPLLPDQLVAVAKALLPDALHRSDVARGRPVRAMAGGRGTALTQTHERGRRVGSMAGIPGNGRRLDLSATLRAAAPWQRLRVSETGEPGEGTALSGPGIRIRRGDLHVQRRVRPSLHRTILLVDASGSQAIRRLGEVKGALELLLAGSYRRREEVALVVFRNREAELVLPPTRSLTRARRLLRGMPGGGGTPLPRALALAVQLSGEARRAGVQADLVLLSDGRPNVDLMGRGDRHQAREDSLALARVLGSRGSPLRILDTSLRGEPFLAELAHGSGGRVDHLPFSDARRLGTALTRGDGGPPR